MDTERLQYLIDTVPAKLLAIDPEDFSRKESPEKWSKKEVIGHLIDSAANNHQRFIRVQIEDVPDITYDQDKWNSINGYNGIDGRHVINFWAVYNRHLISVIKNIPVTALERECNVGRRVTLKWLIEDYIKHLEHHLGKIIPLT